MLNEHAEEEEDAGIVMYSGMDDAMIGATTSKTGDRAVYWGPGMVKILMDDGATHDDAVMWVSFNAATSDNDESASLPLIVWPIYEEGGGCCRPLPEVAISIVEEV
jgi:hypothetical protein